LRNHCQWSVSESHFQLKTFFWVYIPLEAIFCSDPFFANRVYQRNWRIGPKRGSRACWYPQDPIIKPGRVWSRVQSHVKAQGSPRKSIQKLFKYLLNLKGVDKRRGITQPGVCRAVRQKEEFAASENLEFPGEKNS